MENINEILLKCLYSVHGREKIADNMREGRD